MILKNYLHKLSNLRTDKNRNRYPAYTSHRAPHKPFLIAQGSITENFIEPSFELVETFNGYHIYHSQRSNSDFILLMLGKMATVTNKSINI